jgi:hypothetical protein
MSKYIIYLHPNVNTNQYDQLSKLWDHSFSHLTQNSATWYPFHSTLTGFFNSDEPEKISNYIEDLFQDRNNLKCTNIEYNDYGSYKTIIYNSDYLVSKISLLLNEFKYLRSRSLNCLHFTLLNDIKQEENITANYLIHKYIDVKKWEQDWIIIMWEIQDKKWKPYKIIE